MSHRATSCGVGNLECGTAPASASPGSSNKATNFFRIDFAAAPDTCCPIMLLTKLLNGSICSANPVGENNGQGCCSITVFRRGSVASKCAIPCSRSVPVVAVGRGRPVFEGEASSRLIGYAFTEEPWGVRRVAFVRCGSTGRLSGGGVESLLLVRGGRCFSGSSVESVTAGGSGDQ